jgi:hypothetical protein
LEQSTYMYRRLTVAYGILCRDANTPLTTPWVAEGDKQKGTGENRDLHNMFEQLHQAYREFCKCLASYISTRVDLIQAAISRKSMIQYLKVSSSLRSNTTKPRNLEDN